MTIDEIQAELNKMPAALSAAAWKQPDASMKIGANVDPYVVLCEPYATGGYKYEVVRGGTYGEAIAAAWAFIAALPDPQVTILSTYSKKLADAIDYGHENNVPAKLVDPVRRAQKATSDMMLPAPEVTE